MGCALFSCFFLRVCVVSCILGPSLGLSSRGKWRIFWWTWRDFSSKNVSSHTMQVKCSPPTFFGWGRRQYSIWNSKECGSKNFLWHNKHMNSFSWLWNPKFMKGQHSFDADILDKVKACSRIFPCEKQWCHKEPHPLVITIHAFEQRSAFSKWLKITANVISMLWDWNYCIVISRDTWKHAAHSWK